MEMEMAAAVRYPDRCLRIPQEAPALVLPHGLLNSGTDEPRADRPCGEEPRDHPGLQQERNMDLHRLRQPLAQRQAAHRGDSAGYPSSAGENQSPDRGVHINIVLRCISLDARR
jgi:hypothetical protein